MWADNASGPIPQTLHAIRLCFHVQDASPEPNRRRHGVTPDKTPDASLVKRELAQLGEWRMVVLYKNNRHLKEGFPQASTRNPQPSSLKPQP